MKRTSKTVLGAVLVALVTSWGSATAQEMSEEEMAAWIEATSPNEHHAVLEPMVGEWESTIQLYGAPDAEPMEMTATSTAEWIMGGRYLQTRWEGDFAGMPFNGRDMVGYDNVADEYVAVWIDNMSTAPMTSTGTYDPETKTFTYEGTASDPMSGETDVPSKSTIQVHDDGTMTVEMYAPGPDGEMFKTMVIESRKKS